MLIFKYERTKENRKSFGMCKLFYSSLLYFILCPLSVSPLLWFVQIRNKKIWKNIKKSRSKLYCSMYVGR